MTYRALTDAERTNAAHVLRRIEFDHNIQDKFGPETSPDDFPDLDIPDTPEHDNFDDVDYAGQDDEWVKRWCAFTGDGLANGLTSDVDDELPTPSLCIDGELLTPEADDNYVNASLMLPRGNAALNSKMVTCVSSPPMSLPIPCMHRATQMAMNTFCLIPLLITKVIGKT